MSLLNGFKVNAVYIILFVTSNVMLSTKIEKLTVPELAQIGNSSEITLDCQYSVSDNKFTLRWLFNGSDLPIFEWTPGTEPIVGEMLEGKLEIDYRISANPIEMYRAIRILELSPELSGEYTCVVSTDKDSDKQAKTMLVFSPEREFSLESHEMHPHGEVEVICLARGLYPKPELILEHKLDILPQTQRVWRSDGAFYDCEARARWKIDRRDPRLSCRLTLPQAGYTAIRQHGFRHHTKSCENRSTNTSFQLMKPLLIWYLFLYISVK